MFDVLKDTNLEKIWFGLRHVYSAPTSIGRAVSVLKQRH